MAIEEDPPAGVPEWVVTFGDMMSLLLTFFIMLVSMSETKQDQKFHAVVDSMREHFGHDLSMLSLVPGNFKFRSHTSVPSVQHSMGRAKKFNTHNGGDKVRAAVGDHARVQASRPGQTATGGIIIFQGPQANLTDEQRQQLEIVAEEVRGKPQRIEIRGHTTRQPVPKSSIYRDNWDLAYARSRAIMEYLVHDLEIEPERVRLSVSAGNEPATIGRSSMGVAADGRVEVFLLDELADHEGPEG
jgi:chemotaxis protein MotB